MSEKPLKYDQMKTKWHLLQWNALKQVADVATFGAEKYGERNWEKGDGLGYERLFSACMRHLTEGYLAIHTANHNRGIDNDSQKHHLAHAAWNILAILEEEMDGAEI